MVCHCPSSKVLLVDEGAADVRVDVERTRVEVYDIEMYVEELIDEGDGVDIATADEGAKVVGVEEFERLLDAELTGVKELLDAELSVVGCSTVEDAEAEEDGTAEKLLED